MLVLNFITSGVFFNSVPWPWSMKHSRVYAQMLTDRCDRQHVFISLFKEKYSNFVMCIIEIKQNGLNNEKKTLQNEDADGSREMLL